MSTSLEGQRWIVVEDSPFLPASNGGEREHLGLLRAIAAEGALALVVLPAGSKADLDLERYRAELRGVPLILTPRRTSPLLLAHPRLPFVVASRPAPRRLVTRAGRLAPDATGVLLSSFKSRRLGERLGRGLDLPVVLRMHNRESAYHRDLAAGTTGPRGWALRWEARRIEHDEVRLSHAPWLSGIADIAAADAAWRAGLGPVASSHVAPFAIDAAAMPAPARRPSTTPTVLFIGALDVTTNVDAVTWLIDRVWPRVHAARPDAALVVAGRSPHGSLRRLVEAAPGVTLVADPPTMEPLLASAQVGVNPAITGSGVNIKLVEYLTAALPVVSTSHATRGLDLRDGVDLLVRDDPAGFAAAVLDLLADPARAASIGAVGRERACDLLDARRGLRTLSAMMT